MKATLPAKPRSGHVSYRYSHAQFLGYYTPLRVLTIFLLGAAYYFTARWGLTLAPVSGYATFVWPPTGIALAAFLLGGRGLWPAVFAGALLANYANGASLAVSFCIAIGNTLGPLTGATLLNMYGFQNGLRRAKDIALLVGFSALFSTLITATIGTTVLLAGGVIDAQMYLYTWTAWWVGDSLGILVIAPLILIWIRPLRVHLKVKQVVEAIFLATIFVTVGIIIFDSVPESDPILAGAPYLLFSFMIWAAIRFNIRFISLLIFMLSAIAIWSAKYGHGPFYSTSLRTSLFATQLFMGATAVTFLTLTNVMYERRQAQFTVMQLNRKLQTALTKTTQKLQQELELEKLRDEFVATASHELKTPVTSIKAYAQILLQTLSGQSDNQAVGLAKNINKQSDALTSRVDELLDVSSVNAGRMKLHKTSFDIAAVIADIVADFRISANSHAISQRGIKKFEIFADKDRIVQVLQNLLTNAVKYSSAKSQIVVRMKKNAAELIVSVEDKGPGISKGDQKYIFTRFFRTNDSSKSKQAVSGMGLGLYIASEIVKRHGGKLWVESGVGKGSVFTFTLPLFPQSTSK